MVVDAYPVDKLFLHILTLTRDMEPVLAELDRLLDDAALVDAVRADLVQRYPHSTETGRPSTPVEVILRLLVVKRLYGYSYEQLEYQVADSLVLRRFCRVYLNEPPDDTTLIRWAALIRPETLAAFNARVMALAQQLQVTQGRKLRTDGTVVETNIHLPADSSLLADGVRVVARTLHRAQRVVAKLTEVDPVRFLRPIRQARQLAHQIGEVARKTGAAAQKQLQQGYQDLLQLSQQMVEQATQVLPQLKKASGPTAQRLAAQLTTFTPRLGQVIAQTRRRVLDGESVPAGEKLVSLFEEHTDIIRRNKAGHPTEYGHKVWLDEVEGGLVSHWETLRGNPADSEQWAPSLQAHQQLFGHPPHQASADRGVFSAKNVALAEKQGVKHVILPKPGHRTAKQKKREHRAWFVRGRRWQAGIEGRISVLKRRFGLARCRDHGWTGFEKWVGWGVIAANLRQIGQTVVARG